MNMIVGDVLRAVLYLSIPLNLKLHLVDELSWMYTVQFLASSASLFWTPAKDASVPNLVRKDQIEAANQTAGFRTVNLGEISTEVAELFDAAAEGKGGRVEVFGDKTVRISADRDLLFDAISNLVDNAIKHGRDGGLVSIRLDQKNGEAILSVSDDGPGIPSEELEHVFKRFYRLERSRSTPGNGLGLSLVAAVARLHGANIRLFDNAPGLTVELRFPHIDSISEATYRRSAAKAI